MYAALGPIGRIAITSTRKKDLENVRLAAKDENAVAVK